MPRRAALCALPIPRRGAACRPPLFVAAAILGAGGGWASQPGGGGPFVCNGMDARVVLRELVARGADLSRPREAIFYFHGAQASLPGLRRALEGLGFAVRPQWAESGLIAARIAVVDPAWLERTMPQLCRAATRSRASYDGWEAALPEQEANQ